MSQLKTAVVWHAKNVVFLFMGPNLLLLSFCSFSTLAPPVHTPLPARIAMHLLRRLRRDFLLRHPALRLQQPVYTRAPSVSYTWGVDAREADREGRRFRCAPDAHKEVSAGQKFACRRLQTRRSVPRCRLLRRCSEQMKGKEKGGAGEEGGWVAPTCGAASTSGDHVRE